MFRSSLINLVLKKKIACTNIGVSRMWHCITEPTSISLHFIDIRFRHIFYLGLPPCRVVSWAGSDWSLDLSSRCTKPKVPLFINCVDRHVCIVEFRPYRYTLGPANLWAVGGYRFHIGTSFLSWLLSRQNHKRTKRRKEISFTYSLN